MLEPMKSHRHLNVFTKCQEHGKRLCWFGFGTTFGFPLEHLLWEKAPVFSTVTHLLGL